MYVPVCVCVSTGQGCASVRLSPGERTRAREKTRDMGVKLKRRELKRTEGSDEVGGGGETKKKQKTGSSVEEDIWWYVCAVAEVPENTYFSRAP